MARIFTTPESALKAKSIMHDITLAGGIRTNNQKTSSGSFANSYITSAQKICDELVNRNFTDIDAAIRDVAGYGCEPLDGGRYFHPKTEVVAKAIVYMAELVNIYWDDTIRTPYEIDEFKKTLLGDAVYKYGRYISAIKPAKSTSGGGGATTGGGATPTAKTPGQGPANPYKSSGPQSGNVRDLQGQPNQKVYADTAISYKIIADKIGKNTPNVFIKPLSPAGATGNTNKIFISSGNGYTDCTCYFDDPNDAQTFLNKIVAANRVPANIQNIHVAKCKSDPNGYFLVGTEFGTVAVSAKTLNESITEDLSGGWAKATEGCSKEELDELHTWMRKD